MPDPGTSSPGLEHWAERVASNAHLVFLKVMVNNVAFWATPCKGLAPFVGDPTTHEAIYIWTVYRSDDGRFFAGEAEMRWTNLWMR